LYTVYQQNILVCFSVHSVEYSLYSLVLNLFITLVHSVIAFWPESVQTTNFLPGCRSITRHSYFTHLAARTWNSLPEDSTNFSSLALFKRSLSWNILARRCKIYFF